MKNYRVTYQFFVRAENETDAIEEVASLAHVVPLPNGNVIDAGLTDHEDPEPSVMELNDKDFEQYIKSLG